MKPMERKTEGIGVRMKDGEWMIIPASFLLDGGNSFRPIYPINLQYGGISLRFLRETKSGRCLYTEA